MNSNLENKKVLVEEIKGKLQAAKTVVFVDYSGLNVLEADKLRKDFRSSKAEYKVYKNRLVLRALAELGISGVDKYFNGTTSVAFGYQDETGVAKVIVNAINDTKKMSVKFGLLNGKVVDSANISTLAKLPSKQVLVAQLLSVLNGPISSLARVLDVSTRKETK